MSPQASGEFGPKYSGFWIIASSVYILLERRSPQATIAWIATFAVLPLLGFLIYLFLGPRRFDRRGLDRRGLERGALSGQRGEQIEEFVHRVFHVSLFTRTCGHG